MDLTLPERAQYAVRQLAKKMGTTQKEIGVLLGYKNPASFSALLNGKSHYFSATIPARIAALDPAINVAFLTGESDELWLSEDRKQADQEPDPVAKAEGVFIPAELVQMFTDLCATLRSQQDTINNLVGQKGQAANAGK